MSKYLRLFVILGLMFVMCSASEAVGVAHTASGTYTWNATTGVLTGNVTSTDFTCDGPTLGASSNTGVTVTATTMTWPKDNMTWTRASGTAGNIVGTWTATDSTTGNSWTLIANANGTFSFTGVIVSCSSGGGGGSQNPAAYSQHWSNGYSVQLNYDDPIKAATAVSVTGHGITGSAVLTYNAGYGSWNSWTSPSTNVSFGTTYPAGLPFTYTFTITDATGIRTATSTVSCFQTPFATNLSPAGSVTGTPTFSWTGISDTSAVYGVALQDSSNNTIWSNYKVSGTSIAYSGPALAMGATYYYIVSVQSSSACSNGNSFAQGSFTYGNGGKPTCTLIATPSSISAGGTSLLTASCSPAATSYTWSSNAGFASTVNSGTVSPSVTTTYSVSGSNTGGTSDTASATVTVTPSTSTTTAIVASGLWNLKRLDPSCNYTDTGTFNATYANGAYSATIYFSSHHMSPDCQDRGPESCTKTGFFSSAQDLLTTSQFKTMFQAFASSCGDDGSIQSVSFTSPDSVSSIETFPDGSGISAQMTRAPTSYALAVAKTGSGTVTSSSAGINCGSTCSGSFPTGSSVTLTATPASGSYFAGWSGDCTGTGSCSVTINAAKNVTANFKPVPFVATTSSAITATSATITTTVAFNAADVGKQGSVFVTAWIPANGLSALGILAAPMSQAMSVTTTRDNPYTGGGINTRQETLAAFLAAADPNAFVLVQLTTSGWQLVQNGQLIPYATGVLGNLLASQNILNNTNPANLLGAQFCVGYGASAAEMITAGRMLPVAAIPGATAAASGSCNVTDIVVEFYNTNLDDYFITADPIEAAAIDNGSAGPGWSRTGNSFKSGGNTSVCRFYGSQSPGPNSHFYTVDPAECQSLKNQQIPAGDPRKLTEKSWNFESLDFVSTPATNQTCPSGTTPVYRAYNNGFSRGVDSNHRITSSQTAIQQVVTRGWKNEGVVMCAPN